MTDLEKIKALFDEIKIPYTLDESSITYDSLVIEVGGMVVGYENLHTDFDFTKEGRFVQMGVWE